MFVRPNKGDFHLRPYSLCIDRGDSNAPSLPLEDFEGDDRIIGLAPDIGADEVVYTPGNPVRQIIACFDESVENGDLQGTGKKPRVAELRLSMMRWMLVTAAECIERGKEKHTCAILKRCCKRCDGKKRPPDLVGGTATGELFDMIEALMESLDCRMGNRISFGSHFGRR
jgi:hypothetical protein